MCVPKLINLHARFPLGGRRPASDVGLMPDWQRRFDHPIELIGGRELVTLRDAAEHTTVPR